MTLSLSPSPGSLRGSKPLLIPPSSAPVKPQRLGVRVFVPGERGSGCVYRVKTVMVNRVEFNQIQKWKVLGYRSKSSMVLSRYSHRVYRNAKSL